MKKYLLLLLLPIMTVNVWAQNEKPFYLGLYASPNIMWFQSENNNVEPTQSKLGFSYGLLTDITLGDYYAIATGIEIAQLGGKMNWSKLNILHSGNYTLQYVEVPIALKMQTAEINNMSFYGRFGGGMGINIAAKADINNVINQTVLDDVHLFRLFFSVGGGVEYTIAYNTKIFAGIVYKNGLNNTFKENGWNVKANALSINVGVIF